MSKSENLVIVALQEVFGPVVKLTKHWPPVLAFGVPTVVAVLLIAVLSPFLPTAFLVLFGVVIFMILSAYLIVAYIEIRSRGENGHEVPYATITHPTKNQTVGGTIVCTGTARGIPNNMTLWLAVETLARGTEDKVRIWPKENEVVVNKNRWSCTIFEDGATPQFCISLWLADPVGDEFIREWLEAGRSNGEYKNLKGIKGAQRLTRVEGLRRDFAATKAATNAEVA